MPQPQTKILVVDDDEKILFAFQEVFKKEGYKSIVARSGDEALEKISMEQPHVVFMDISMPKLNGLEVLSELKQRRHGLPVILITGYGTIQTAVKAMQLGAFEYLTKPVDIEKVRELVKRALMSRRISTSPEQNKKTFNAEFADRYEIVGHSKQMQEIYKLIGSISTTPNHTSVLIHGESGTGKELVARAIHSYSRHHGEPFVGINCTGLPETLLESELFGYEKGAFTGATERKPGKFEIARSGTIFLDEIGNLSFNLQQKLLRVLQEREFERVGGNEPIRVEARFIAASNRKLEAEVKKNNFREDLFFRLNVAAIHLPRLQERKEDIPLLASYFLGKYAEQLKKTVRDFSAEAMEMLESYWYPGNVRELENLIERAVMLTKGDVILPEALSEMLKQESVKSFPLPIPSPIFGKSRDIVLRMFEKQFVTEQLKKHHGNVTEAARASKMTRQNFQRLITKHKIRASTFRK